MLQVLPITPMGSGANKEYLNARTFELQGRLSVDRDR